MASQILKPDCSFLTMRPETVMTDPSPSTIARLMLFMNRTTGAILAGIGVMVLVANVLIGCGLLFSGPEFIIEFLAQ